VIRAFVRNGPEAERFAIANGDLTATALSVNRVFALTMPAVMAILNLSSVAVLYFGGTSSPRGRCRSAISPPSSPTSADPLLGDDGGDGGDPGASRAGERRAHRAVLDTEPSIVDPATPADRAVVLAT